MFQNKWIAGMVLATASMISLLPAAHAQKRPAASYASEDDAFLALRDAARRDDARSAEELAARLATYAIPSYIDYYRLKP
ncbi:MAG: lytic transglycosylase domain-containing protein, partial [Herminiimonas sp.]|nr:lytic transglycosylase domain-containing protein [Herminiimonas sp.]